MASNDVRLDVANRRRLKDVGVPVRLKLSAMWASVMFLYVYVDVFGFYQPGTIDGILAGRVWEFDITQGWALGALGPHDHYESDGVPVTGSVGRCGPRDQPRHCLTVHPCLHRKRGGRDVGLRLVGSAVETVLLLMIARLAWTWPRDAGHDRPVASLTG